MIQEILAIFMPIIFCFAMIYMIYKFLNSDNEDSDKDNSNGGGRKPQYPTGGDYYSEEIKVKYK
jgi:hypothetical protein